MRPVSAAGVHGGAKTTVTVRAVTFSHYPPSAEVRIESPIDHVWSVLLDGDSYPIWNEFIFAVDGDLQATGSRIGLSVKLGKRTARPTMKTTELVAPGANGQAKWVHQFASRTASLGLLRSERHHQMTSTDDGESTVYTTHETFWGPLKALMPFKQIDHGFKEQTNQLKTYCEETAPTAPTQRPD